MPYINIKETKLFFDTYGSHLNLTGEKLIEKPTVVVLHGFPGGDHTYELNLWRDLADHFNIVLYDHRGHGRSEGNDPKTWNLNQWADDVYDFCNALGINKPIIYGDSFGSHVGFCYATKYPHQPGALIFIDGEAYFDKTELLNAYEKVGGDEIRELARLFFEEPTDEIIDEYFAKAIPFISRDPIPETFYGHVMVKADIAKHYHGGECFTFDFRDQLDRIECPVLYITAENGVVHRVNAAKSSAKSINSALLTFKVFKGAGIASLDEIKRCQKEIIAFIKRCD